MSDFFQKKWRILCFKFILFQEFLEGEWFFVYLFVVSNVYFVFIIYQVFASKTGTKKSFVTENEKVIQSITLFFVDVIFLLPAH